MKVLWKQDGTQVGIVLDVYVTDWGQKRMMVAMPYSTIDAQVDNFELVN
jgi:hypothetical protein